MVELENMTKHGQNDTKWCKASSEVSLKTSIRGILSAFEKQNIDSQLHIRWISNNTARGILKTISKIPLEYQTGEFGPSVGIQHGSAS